MNWHTYRRALSVVAVAMLLALCLQGALLACPTCKDSLAQSDPNAANLVRGYFWSILFMMSMPFLIFFGLSTYFYLEVRRARKRQAVAVPSVAGKPALVGGAAAGS